MRGAGDEWRQDRAKNGKPAKSARRPSRATTSITSSRRDGVETEREKQIGQHIGYRYDVNLLPDYSG